MTTPPAKQPASTPAKGHPTKPKKPLGVRMRNWVLVVFGPSVLVGAVVWFFLKGHVESSKAMYAGLGAAILFFFAWQAFSMRIKKAGRSMAYTMRSLFSVLLLVGIAVAAVWFLWLKP